MKHEKYKKRQYLFLITLSIILLSSVHAGYASSFADTYRYTDDMSSGTSSSEDGLVLNLENSEGTPLDVMVTSGWDYGINALSQVGDAFIYYFCESFAPSFDALTALGEGRQINVGEDGQFAHTSDDFSSSYIVSTILQFAWGFGVVLVNLLLLSHLFLCLVGRSEVIRDNPVGLIAKYVLAWLAMYFAPTIIFKAMEIWYDFWQFVVSIDGNQTISMNDFSIVTREESRYILFGVYIKVESIMANILFSFFTIFLVWKIVKNFIRLYLEIIERYFVLMLVALLFPAVVPTAITNNTKNIFNSYLRMFFSQGFVLIINTVFMKIFVHVLLLGGWTNGIVNYVACLAFLKVCQRIDSYMLTMGLNVAQTGGGFAAAVGGSLGNLGSSLRSLRSFNEGRKNIGAGIAEKAVRSGNESAFAFGKAFGADLKDVSSGALSAPALKQSFAAQNAQNIRQEKATSANSIPGYGTGKVTHVSNNNNIHSMLSEAGINSSYAQKLTDAGVNPSDISKFEQLDQSGNHWGVYDKDGMGIAALNNGDVYTQQNRSSIIEQIKNVDSMAQQSGDPSLFQAQCATTGHYPTGTGPNDIHMVSNDDVRSATGGEIVAADNAAPDSKCTYNAGEAGIEYANVRTYTGPDMGSGRPSSIDKYEFVSPAMKPNVMTDRRYSKYTNADGNVYYYRKLGAVNPNNSGNASNPADQVTSEKKGKKSKK